MKELVHYLSPDGKDVFQSWLDKVTRKDKQAAIRILTRLNRLAAGNAGDCKSVGRGVRELRMTYGPGYRIYYAEAGGQLVVLLLGGNKKGQSADIEQAQLCWQDFKRRQI